MQAVGIEHSCEKYHCKWEQRNGIVAGQYMGSRECFLNGQSCIMVLCREG